MKKRHAIAIIMLAVLAWGVFHAIGAFTFKTQDRSWQLARPLMVLGCSLAFLGFWLLMLANRRRRLQRQQRPGEGR